MRIIYALLPWQLFSIFKGNTVNKIYQVRYSRTLLFIYSQPQITIIQHLSHSNESQVESRYSPGAALLKYMWHKTSSSQTGWVFSVTQITDSSNFLQLNEIVNLLLMNVSLQRYFSQVVKHKDKTNQSKQLFSLTC